MTQNAAVLARPDAPEPPAPHGLHDSIETLQTLAFIRDRCLTLPPRAERAPAPARAGAR